MHSCAAKYSDKFQIDEEIEIDGVLYWLQAEVRSGEIRDLRLYGYDARTQGYEDSIEEPRLLSKAGEMAISEAAHG
jgi:hypothetical protein